MSTSAAPSSSLHTLEQRNRSKSTVSSSSLETEAESVTYASSSGTTTPEDDAQTFHLGHTLQNALADERLRHAAGRDKSMMTTKHRTFSSALKKVKKVAHALGVFKKKKAEDMSPISIGSPLRERFGKRMSVKSHPDECFYSLPNRRFSFSDVTTPSVSIDLLLPVVLLGAQHGHDHQHHHEPRLTRKFGTISGPTSGFDKSRRERRGHHMPSLSASQRATLPSPPVPTAGVMWAAHDNVWTLGTILFCVFRLLLFVPWCAAVGGALLLFPSYVEYITFGPGYLTPRRGLRRFAYWAECGQQHVMIFLACMVAVPWYTHVLGLSLASIAVWRLVWVWHAFELDMRIPLGEDDQQSIYFILMGGSDGSAPEVRGERDR